MRREDILSRIERVIYVHKSLRENINNQIRGRWRLNKSEINNELYIVSQRKIQEITSCNCKRMSTDRRKMTATAVYGRAESRNLQRNMSSALCASSMYSRLCMKMLSFLFVRAWAMLRTSYLSCGIPFPVQMPGIIFGLTSCNT